MESEIDLAVHRRVLTVSELTRSVRGLLETTFPFVTVTGEISNLRRPYSGHLYFTLKDARAQLRCVLFKTQQRYCTAPLEDGAQVLARGRLTVYEPRGDYQLVADLVEPYGAGALQAAFEALRQRLAAEGLFDQASKRPLPRLIEKIVVITSPSGAAIRDFLRTTANRFPLAAVTVIPVRVQGEGASQEIIHALETANRLDLGEVVVLCRGGGSIEDLWAFNDEDLARAIRRSRLPVVTGVGHESDTTIADFAADLRAATPTAAAAAVTPDRAELAQHIFAVRQRLQTVVRRRLERESERLHHLRRRLGDPTTLLAHLALRLDHRLASLARAMDTLLHRHRLRLENQRNRLQRLDPRSRLEQTRNQLTDLRRRLLAAVTILCHEHRRRLSNQRRLLIAMDPRQVVRRGYALVFDPEDRLVTDATQIPPGGRFRVTLAHGHLLGQRLPEDQSQE